MAVHCSAAGRKAAIPAPIVVFKRFIIIAAERAAAHERPTSGAARLARSWAFVSVHCGSVSVREPELEHFNIFIALDHRPEVHYQFLDPRLLQ